MMSTVDVSPEYLADIAPMLNQFGIKVIGSKLGDGVVCLAIEGDIVPTASKVMVEVTKVIGQTFATLTARCIPVDEATGSKENHDAHFRQPG